MGSSLLIVAPAQLVILVQPMAATGSTPATAAKMSPSVTWPRTISRLAYSIVPRLRSHPLGSAPAG